MRSNRRQLIPETLYRANIAKLLCFMLHFYFIENAKHDIRYTTCEATHGTTHDMRIDTQRNIAQMSWSCRVFTGVLAILINHTMKKQELLLVLTIYMQIVLLLPYYTLQRLFKYCPWSQNWPRHGGHFICIEIYWEHFENILECLKQ